MNNSLYTNFFVGLILLLVLIGFYELTLKVFYPTLYFFTYLVKPLFNPVEKTGLVKEINENPALLVGYCISFTVQILSAVICVNFRNYLIAGVTISDVLLICVTPAFVYFLISIPYYILEYINSNKDPNLYQYIILQNSLLLGANTTVIILGGLLGWAVCKILT